MGLEINVGYISRVLDVVGDHCKSLAKDLRDLPKNYCTKCGGDLYVCQPNQTLGEVEFVIKRCKICGEKFSFEQEEFADVDK